MIDVRRGEFACLFAFLFAVEILSPITSNSFIRKVFHFLLNAFKKNFISLDVTEDPEKQIMQKKELVSSFSRSLILYNITSDRCHLSWFSPIKNMNKTFINYLKLTGEILSLSIKIWKIVNFLKICMFSCFLILFKAACWFILLGQRKPFISPIEYKRMINQIEILAPLLLMYICNCCR